jgi:protein-S-isoprenylcysteine O-methyltransferase Ste14
MRNKQESINAVAMNRWVQIICNCILLLIFSFFIINFLRAFSQTKHLSSLLYILLNLVMIFFCVQRRSLRNIDVALYPSICALAGGFLPLFAQPGHSPEILLGHIVQCLGIVFSIGGILSLNKSFGLLAANRGIISNGLYKYVRHPLYFSYEISFLGFLINNLILYNVVLFLIHLFFQVQRIRQEENLLISDPEYQNYCLQTKWRFVPYIY